MSQASQPARAPDPSVVVSQPSVGGVIGKHSVHTGRTVGPFEIQTLIAAGAFAEVYEARSELVGAAAVKIGPLLEPRRFERELSALKGVNHPNLIKFHEGGTFSQDGKEFFWLAMEYPGPCTLAHLIAQQRLELNLALNLFGQLLEALCELHAAQLVHRDLKPQNILVNDQQLKVIDFGLTKSFGASGGNESLTLTGQLVGTPRYMSPEQVKGSSAVGPSSDVWASLVIFYEMLTGQPLFDGTNQMQLGAQILGAPVRSLLNHESVLPELRAWMAEVLDQTSSLGRESATEALANFNELRDRILARELNVRTRQRWLDIRRERVIERALELRPATSDADVVQHVKALCVAERLGIPDENELARVVREARLLFVPGDPRRVTQFLLRMFEQISVELDEPPRSDFSFLEFLRRLNELPGLSKFFGVLCVFWVWLVIVSFGQAAWQPVYETSSFQVAAVGLGASSAVAIGAWLKQLFGRRKQLNADLPRVALPKWNRCPGTFYTFIPGQMWQTRLPVKTGLQRLPANEAIAFEASTTISDSDLASLLRVPRLSAVLLSRCRNLTDRGFMVLGALPSVVELYLNDTLLARKGLESLVDLPLLRVLDVSGCERLGPDAFEVLGKLGDLHALDLGFLPALNHVGLRQLSRIPRLEKLCMNGCRNLNDKSLDLLAQFPELASLSVRWCEQITDLGMENIGRLKTLRSLDLRGLPNLTDVGLTRLASLSFLQQLHISECNQLTPAGVASLRRALPLCRVDERGEFELPRYLY